MRFAVALSALNIAIFLIFRAIFFLAFREEAIASTSGELGKAAWIGAKMDVRLALILGLPAALGVWIPFLDPARGTRAVRGWVAWLTLVFGVVAFLYFVDFGHFGWLHERVNASAIDYLLAWQIAVQTVWESYPIVWILLGLAAIIAAYGFAVSRLLVRPLAAAASEPRLPGKRLAAVVVAAVLVYAAGIYGKVSAYPLRWSDAFFSTDPFACALGLNPVLYTWDSLLDWKAAYDVKATRKHYARMAKLLEVDHPDENTLTFARHYVPEKRFDKPPNVVIVFMESFAALKVGRFGHVPDLDPTPNFDELTKKSVFFTHFFVPRPPTARAIFATLFSLPDVNPTRSASRNPLIVHQRTVANAFDGYDKLYLLGGSANWGEIRGMLSTNIPGLKLFEEGSYPERPDDVWGINDLALLEEANKAFRKEDKPFLAFVQLAGNHPPYTIPDDHRDFHEENVDEATLIRNGFSSLKAYNGIRFMDYAVGNFFKVASQEKYFDDTIFILYGDHGTATTLDVPYKEDGMISSEHIPAIFYAPKLLPPQVIDHVASSVDVLPTAAQLAGLPFDDTAFGRPIFTDRPEEMHFAYVSRGNSAAVVTDRYVFDVDPGGHKHLYEYDSPDHPTEDLSKKLPDVSRDLDDLLAGCDETSKWMLYHNGSEKHSAVKAMKVANTNGR